MAGTKTLSSDLCMSVEIYTTPRAVDRPRNRGKLVSVNSLEHLIFGYKN